MKKSLLIALAIGLFSVGAQAQKKKTSSKKSSVTVPQIVADSFGVSYNTIESKKWSKTLNGNYVAEFKNSDTLTETAEYDKNGTFQKSKVKLEAENLPENIKISLDSSYVGAKIVSAERIKIKDINPFYNVKVETTDNQKKTLLISEEGTITE